MPLRDYKLLVLGCQVFSFFQLGGFQAHRFSQDHAIFKFKDCLTIAFADVDVNRQVFVTVEEKSESILYEYGRHGWE